MDAILNNRYQLLDELGQVGWGTVYRANDRPVEADDYLRQAYERVLLAAGKTTDDDLRRNYMENVHENRDILKEAKARGTAKEELGNVGDT